jgi:xylulokinase
LEEKSYPKELLDIIGIQMSKFPNVINPGEEAGTINSKLADEIGINHDAKVIVSSYDAICSFVGSGVSEEGEASDVSGTVTVFRTYTKKNVNKSTKIYQVPLYSEQANIVGGSNNLGGGLIEWVKQCYYTNEEYPYEIMEKDARESEIGAKGLIFLPYLLGERAPLWDDNARGVFFGLERMHTRKDMTRAVFESTGFIDMDMIEAVNETGVDVESVRLSGGLARLNLVSQIKSDILGRDVLVLSEFETTSSGAAMMVLIGQGIYSNQKEAAVKFANIRMIIKPDMENHKKYQYMYGLYKDTYQSLKGLFVRRTHILEEIRSGREVKIENL